MKMKKILLAVTVFLSANIVAGVNVPITIENFSFELPGTTRQLNWENVPGWNSDSFANDSGVETGWGATDGIWSGFITGSDPSIWQLTNHIIIDGEVFELKVDAKNNHGTATLEMNIYYDDGGIPIYVATNQVILTNTMKEYSLLFSVNDVPSSIGHKIGIEFDNITLGTYNRLGLDNVRLTLITVNRRSLASEPKPDDGAENVSTSLLQWIPGLTATFHDVYFGTNPEPGLAEFQGRLEFPLYWHAPGLKPDTTYYWRVDEVEADGTTIYPGNVWSFTSSHETVQNSGPPYSALYTTNEDFDLGTMVAVEHDTVADQLQLSEHSVTLPFIWVPNSNEGTVSKIDTRTGREIARYRTGPASRNGNPSRTTIDLNGNCWVGNRRTGTVVKIGLFEGGQYMDRNYNGIIETSSDLNGDGQITGDEMLPWANDECVIYEVMLIPGSEKTYIPGQFQGAYTEDDHNPGPRGIAVDGKNNIWAGCYGTKTYYYIDGASGQILNTINLSLVNHTPYGAVVDENGILWSSGQDKKHVLRLDPTDFSFQTIALSHYVYGLGIDGNGHLFISGWEDMKLSCIDIFTTTVLWTKTGGYSSRGVVCTGDGDIWVADSESGMVSHYDNDGNLKNTINVGNTPTGVAVDSDGKVWVVCLGGGYIFRIDPVTEQIDLTKIVTGTQHYGYSDMTGIVSRNYTSHIGSWKVFHDTGAFDSQLGLVSWTSIEPKGTSLNVKVRSSDDSKNWSDWEQIINGKGPRRILAGRYYEIEAVFESYSDGISPILYDLTVKPSPCCGDIDHPYPPGDANMDCMVDFTDLAIMASHWLECTAPDCN
jgi:DNA-binding beta-propeller fold protein YncE